MLTCPYDPEHQFKQFSGLSAHMRLEHSEFWKGSIDSSLPDGRDMASLGTPEEHPLAHRTPVNALTALAEQESARTGRPVKAFVGRGERKPPILTRCSFCTWKTNHPPALAGHIKGNHPEKWRGTVAASRGDADRSLSPKERDRAQMREYNRNYRARMRKTGSAALNPRFNSVALASFEQPCLFCNDYESNNSMALAAHIRMAHKTKWRKNLETTLGPKGAKFLAAVAEARQEMARQRSRDYYTKQRKAAKKTAARPVAEQVVNGAMPEQVQQRQQPTRPTRGHIDYCPHCGHNLQAISIALGMMQGE